MNAAMQRPRWLVRRHGLGQTLPVVYPRPIVLPTTGSPTAGSGGGTRAQSGDNNWAGLTNSLYAAAGPPFRSTANPLYRLSPGMYYTSTPYGTVISVTGSPRTKHFSALSGLGQEGGDPYVPVNGSTSTDGSTVIDTCAIYAGTPGCPGGFPAGGGSGTTTTTTTTTGPSTLDKILAAIRGGTAAAGTAYQQTLSANLQQQRLQMGYPYTTSTGQVISASSLTSSNLLPIILVVGGLMVVMMAAKK